MKLKQINKNRLLNNTVTNFWIKTSSVVIVGASVAYGFYIYYYQADSFIGNFVNFTNKFYQRIERKTIDTQNRPLQQNAYQAYLQEKKLYNKELEEETRRRLEKLRSVNEPKTQETVKAVVVEAKPQVEIDPNEIKKPSLRRKVLYYLTLGYVKY